MSVAATLTTPEPVLNWRQALERAGIALRSGYSIEAPTFEFSPLPGQPRKYFNPEAMQRLTESIRSPLGQIFEGLARLAPPERGTKYELIDGERRWRSCREAGIPYRVRIIEIDDATLPYIIAAIANFNRESMTVTDVVKSMEFLLKLGASWKDVSQVLGGSVQWLQKLYTLRNLTTEVWGLMDPNRPQAQILNTMAAIRIAELHKSQQYPLAKRVLEQRMTTAAVKYEVELTAKKSGQKLARKPRATRKTWRSMCNRIGAMARTSIDLEMVVSGEEAEGIFAGRTAPQIEALLRQVQASMDNLQKVRTHLVNKCIVAPQEAQSEELTETQPAIATS